MTKKEMEQKLNDLADLQEINVLQRSQAFANYNLIIQQHNARFAKLEQQLIEMQNSLVSIAFANKEN